MLVELIFWKSSGPTFCCILWLTLMFTSTFSAVINDKNTFFILVVVSSRQWHGLGKKAMAGPLSNVLLFVNVTFLIILFEEVQSWRYHSFFVERSRLFVVGAVRLIVGLEVGHFYCDWKFICNFLFINFIMKPTFYVLDIDSKSQHIYTNKNINADSA